MSRITQKIQTIPERQNDQGIHSPILACLAGTEAANRLAGLATFSASNVGRH